MTTVFCAHCDEGVKEDEYVYVINRRAYCTKCFETFVTSQARMTAHDYANSWGCVTKVLSKE